MGTVISNMIPGNNHIGRIDFVSNYTTSGSPCINISPEWCYHWQPKWETTGSKRRVRSGKGNVAIVINPNLGVDCAIQIKTKWQVKWPQRSIIIPSKSSIGPIRGNVAATCSIIISGRFGKNIFHIVVAALIENFCLLIDLSSFVGIIVQRIRRI